MASSSVYRYNRENEERNSIDDIYTYHITLEQTTSESDIDPSDAESVESVQANTTVSAKDSSDISTDELSDYLMSEYEVASSPETIERSTYDKEFFSSSSSPREIELVFSCSASDKSNATDVSDYDGDIIGAIGDNKYYHTCAQCFLFNANPAFRFCDSCYQLRKESFPSKPKPKKKRQLADHDRPAKKQKLTPENSAFQDVASSSQETVESKNFDNPVSKSTDSGFESVSPIADWEMNERKEKCLTCLNSCVNGLILHGRTAHRCCCYKCSKKIWSESRKCPICRRKINNVILLLNC